MPKTKQPISASSHRCLAIVPAFNERASVRKVVHRLKRALPEFDVLVIDDGSTDDTVRQVPAGTPVVTLPFNLGIGGAMQTGYRYAALHGYDIAVQVDGDGQHRPSEVRRLVAELERSGSDLVVGSRFLLPNPMYRETLLRQVGAWCLRALLRLTTGMEVTDCTSGFRAANRRVIRAFAHWYPEDYPEPEVILLLHRAGYRISELAVRMRQRCGGRSSINFVAGLFYVMKVSVCLLLDLIREPWPRGKVVDHAFDPAPVAGPSRVGRTGRAGRRAAGSSRRTVDAVPQPVPGALWGGPPAAGREASPQV